MKIAKRLIALMLLVYSGAYGQPTTGITAHYATVNGLKMYYVTAGKGTPVVLLHGAFSMIDKDFGKIIPVLAKDHLVIGVELQGHGHTADINRQFSYEAFASDVASLLEQLKITRTDIVGYSMGGGAALQLSITRPDLIAHLVLLSTAYGSIGMNTAPPTSLQPKPQGSLDESAWRMNYNKVAPDTAKWAALKQKVFGWMGTWKGFQAEEIKKITAPALLLFGDEDMSSPEHHVEMFRLVGGGYSGDLYQLPNVQLGILPGTTHVTMVDQTDLLVPIITRFLSTPSKK